MRLLHTGLLHTGVEELPAAAAAVVPAARNGPVARPSRAAGAHRSTSHGITWHQGVEVPPRTAYFTSRKSLVEVTDEVVDVPAKA